MPSLQSIVVTDRATTPVNHTLTPTALQSGNVGLVSEKVAGQPISNQLRLSISNQMKNGKMRGRLVLTAPVVATEVINGVNSPKLLRTAVADLSVVFDEHSTTQERDDLVGMLASALANTKVLVDSTFVEGENVWG